MIEDNDNFKRIKLFLDNEMSLEERKKFEEELSKSKSLKLEVEEQKLLTSGLYFAERERLKTKALGWARNTEATLKPDSSPSPQIEAEIDTKSISYSRIMGLAASILLVVSMGYFLFYQKNQGPQELVNQYLAVYHQDPVVLRGGNKNEIWSKSIAYYRRNDFDKMITTMQHDVYSNNVNAEQLFYFGLAHLYKNPIQLDSALHYLAKADTKNNRTFHDEAEWYESLILLKQGKTNAAKPILTSLAKRQNPYMKKSSELLKTLEEKAR